VAELPIAPAFDIEGFSAAPPVACYSRVVVHPEWRGRGLARLLDEAATEHSRTQRYAALVGVVTSARARVLSRYGFRTFGPANLRAWPGLTDRVVIVLAPVVPDP
jgi:predicted N-acetyltransferase YhbS